MPRYVITLAQSWSIHLAMFQGSLVSWCGDVRVPQPPSGAITGILLDSYHFIGPRTIWNMDSLLDILGPNGS